MVWSILDVGRADQIKTAKVTVKEGTQKDELILDLIQGLGHILRIPGLDVKLWLINYYSCLDFVFGNDWETIWQVFIRDYRIYISLELKK